MTNADILTVVNGVLENYDGGGINDLLDLKFKLQEVARMDYAKKTGGAKQATILKRMMDANEKVNGDGHCSRGYTPYEGQFFFLDGYKGYWLNSDFGYDEAKTHMGGIETLVKSSRVDYADVEIDMADLKMHILEHKCKSGIANRGKPYGVNYTLNGKDLRIGFNACFLRDMLEMFKTKTISFSNTVSPAHIEGQNGEHGILLPVRLKEGE